MNPSVQQIMQGIQRAGAENTIFLPNNKNIVLTAQQVAANDPYVHVIPTRSIPQGVAALLAYNPLSSLEENLAAMEETLSTVTTIEVTQAVRDTSVDGVAVSLGRLHCAARRQAGGHREIGGGSTGEDRRSSRRRGGLHPDHISRRRRRCRRLRRLRRRPGIKDAGDPG